MTATPARPGPPAACHPPHGRDRRNFLRRLLALSLTGLAAACARPEPLVRVAGIVWIGYEPLFLARELGLYEGARLRLVETPSNTSSLMALASAEVEAATLTLDECLLAREGGLDVRVILVFDESAGADVIMVRPEIHGLEDLRGRRVGVEHTAAGALMLTKLLQVAGMGPADIVKVPLTGDLQIEAYRKGAVDALVSFEPYATRLAHLGARRLLDSSRFPGLIVDVLVARADALELAAEPLRRLTAGYFAALDHLRRDPHDAAARMAPRMGLTSAEVLAALEGVHLLDRAANAAWLAGAQPRLAAAARELGQLMQRAGLLSGVPDVAGLADARFLGRLPRGAG